MFNSDEKKERQKGMCCLFSSIAIKFEKVVNTYFIDDKYLRSSEPLH